MSDYHGLDVQTRGDRIRVVFHLTVPAENNAIGYPLQQAVKEFNEDQSETGIIETAVPWDIGLELNELQAGQLVETVEIVTFDINASLVERQNAMDQRWRELDAESDDFLRTKFEFWGRDRDVPPV